MKTLWNKMLEEIIREYQTNPTTFLRQKTISKTVHPNGQKVATNCYQEMITCSFCKKNILPKLKDSSVGTPFQFKHMPHCSPLNMQHAYNIHLLHKHLDIVIPQDVNYIVEVGGGYGNFCRLINQLGYSGRYTIVDFPPMLDIQKTFLAKNSISNVEFSTLKASQMIPKSSERSLLMGTFSINEMPMENRQIIEPLYNKYDYLHIVHNSFFDGIDNMEYFRKLRTKLNDDFETIHIKLETQRAWALICKNKRLEAPDG